MIQTQVIYFLFCGQPQFINLLHHLNPDVVFLEEGEYNAHQAGMTSGIVIAILIPVIALGFCAFMKIRSNGSERQYQEYPLQRIPQNEKPQISGPIITSGSAEKMMPLESSHNYSKSSLNEREL
eukprot:TRINITY_DN996_c0_g2_i4.p1 TRINITY_DN996_c0_g2~~TRINITY_DN996_c0_g2_i4.p1  ORF type:complete len:133 (-),score=7.09 TRINITY_DN996_c0_g2_i4:122-493(-)